MIRTLIMAIFTWVLPCALAHAQRASSPDEMLREIIETYIPEKEENSDRVEEMFMNLTVILDEPVNLNTAGREELAKLIFLSDYQCKAILDYRERKGRILSVYELLYVPGIQSKEVEFLSHFAYCGETPPNAKDPGHRRGKLHAEGLMGYQRQIETEQGYKALTPDTLLQRPVPTAYLGSPGKMYLKYRLKFNRRMDCGMLGEKDAGEPFAKGQNRSGFDYYSMYFQYRPEKGPVNCLLLGDYRIHYGQGLLIRTGFGSAKGSPVTSLLKPGKGPGMNHSFSESGFLRGISSAGSVRRFMWTGFYSYRKLDAVVDTMEGTFSSVITSGLHRSHSEFSKKANLTEMCSGASVHYTTTNLLLGANLVFQRYNREYQPREYLYTAFYPGGKYFSGISVDYRYLGRKFRMAGEVARYQDTWAVIHGFHFYLRPRLTLCALLRHYDASYHAFYANAFSDQSVPRNERGVFLGIDGSFNRLSFRFYTDIYTFPWLRYGIPVPSDGYELLAELGWLTSLHRLQIRCKAESKFFVANGTAILSEIQPLNRYSLRFTHRSEISEHLRIDSRIENSTTHVSDRVNAYGWLAYLGMRADVFNSKILLCSRLTVFSAPAYESRIYAYEPDVRYTFSSRQFYGKGWRCLLLCTLHPTKYLRLEFRISHTRYPYRTELGQGPGKLQSNHITELRTQLIVRI